MPDSFKKYIKKISSNTAVQFCLWFLTIFLFTATVLILVGLAPSEFSPESGQSGILDTMRLFVLGANGSPSVVTPGGKDAPSTDQYQEMINSGEIPLRLVIQKAGVDTNVNNPSSTNIDYLDNELSKGPVHYPGSGYPGHGNTFIFGHSTGFKVVYNQAYKVFNDLQSLQAGDAIQLYTSGYMYTYNVETVTKVDKNDTWVTFDPNKNLLTLSTCDSFGQKTDRFVVVASYGGRTKMQAGTQ